MSGMEQFFTRDKANDGRRVELKTPAGKATEHWILVLSQHSDAFRQARDLALQVRGREIAQIKDEAERRRRAGEELAVVQAALVADWSFPDPCTPENVLKFLKAAPQISDAIGRVAEDDASFFAESPSSTPGPETSAV